MKSFNAGGWMPSAAGFRKVIDISTVHLDPNLKSVRNMEDRINSLHKAGLLSDGLHDMAHVVRLDGNEEVHDEPLTEEDEASQLKDFTEVFLRYVFTMPQHVTEAIARHPQLATKIAAAKKKL